MKTVIRKYDAATQTATFVDGDAVTDISKLDNDVIVKIEKKSNIAKMLKKTRGIGGSNELFSAKSIKEALAKPVRKNKILGTYCCCCGEIWTTREDGFCHECDLSI